MTPDILIVGGGLSGLALADQLTRQGRDWHLIEAFDRFGGRILSQTIGGAGFDLGPAWFWPGQPRIAALIARFGLRAFDQFSTGTLMFQDQSGAVQANRGHASMQGSLRIEGGMGALIAALVASLPQDRLTRGSTLSDLSRTTDGVSAGVTGGRITARRVVLALPPRVVGDGIRFAPPLPAAATTALTEIPTWMAGQAKILAVYDRPHWRDAGYSGDAMSQSGPMVELHDASPRAGGPYALFGFVGHPADVRAQHHAAILDLAQRQLIALFGPKMGKPLHLSMQDWATMPGIATARDRAPLREHPDYGLSAALRHLWSGRIVLGSTETAPTFGGYLEGALEAAEATAETLDR